MSVSFLTPVDFQRAAYIRLAINTLLLSEERGVRIDEARGNF